MREILRADHAVVAEVVVGFGGFVAKYMGDSVLVYFGYPQAHEHDAEQAVSAGLELVERIGRLESGSGVLASRVGIATGLVVVGDLIGSGESRERGVVGDPARRPRRGDRAAVATVGAGQGRRRADRPDLG